MSVDAGFFFVLVWWMQKLDQRGVEDMVALKQKLTLVSALVAATTSYDLLAQGPTHAYLNTQRSSFNNHYFIGVGVEGEYGSANSIGENFAAATGVNSRNMTWKGQGVRNQIGVEYLKFVQFTLSHADVNLRNSSNGAETLSGSRFGLGTTLSFYAPLGNLRLGADATAANYDYRRDGTTSSYVGSGMSYRVGYNYFLTYNISFQANVEQLKEKIQRNGGSSETASSIRKETTLVGMGFMVWL